MNNATWLEFEECLNNAGNIEFWWRDDDVRAKKTNLFDLGYWKYTYRLEKIMSLLKKYNIPSIFGVVPHNFYEYGNKLIKLLKKYNVFISVHGIKHINNSKNSNMPLSEFPDGCDIEENLKIILENQKKFKAIFEDKLLPVFIPPYNHMCAELKNSLLEAGFTAVSTSNSFHSEHCKYNVDFDFINWQELRLKDDDLILKEIINLINSGIKVIGINSHHPRIKGKGFKFFNKFFKTTKKFNNVKWIIPF